MAPLIPIGLAIARTVAPHLVEAFKGPKAAEAATTVIDVASSVVGAKSPEEVLERVREDADAARRVSVELSEFDLEWLELAAEDRHSARMASVQRSKRWGVDPMPAIVALLVFALLAASMFGFAAGPPLVEFLKAAAMAIVTFYFGSSVGSKRKEEQIGEIARGAPARRAPAPAVKRVREPKRRAPKPQPKPEAKPEYKTVGELKKEAQSQRLTDTLRKMRDETA